MSSLLRSPLLVSSLRGVLRGGGGARAVPFISDGAILPVSWFRRPHTPAGAAATAVAADGVTMSVFAQNTVRPQGAARRVLVEGPSTNLIRNPRGEGAVIGTPGVAPTNWAIGTGTGLTWQLAGTGVAFGVPFIDVRVTGSPAGPSFLNLVFETGTGVPAVNGEQFTGSYCARLAALAAGPGPSLHQVQMVELTAAGAAIGEQRVSVSLPTSGSGLLGQRFVQTATLNQGATTAHVRHGAVFEFPAGTHDATIRIGVPQLERMPFATSIALPPVGVPGTALRTLDRFGLPYATAFLMPGRLSVLCSLSFLRAPAVGGRYAVTLTENASALNALGVTYEPGGVLRATSVSSGAFSGTDLGAVAPGTLARFGFSINGDRMAASLNGAAPAILTGPTADHVALRLGHYTQSDTLPMFAEVQAFTIVYAPLSDADLQTRVASL